MSNLRANDSVPTIKVLSVYMHGATFAPRTPGFRAGDLREHAEHVVTHQLSPAMTAI